MMKNTHKCFLDMGWVWLFLLFVLRVVYPAKVVVYKPDLPGWESLGMLRRSELLWVVVIHIRC